MHRNSDCRKTPTSVRHPSRSCAVTPSVPTTHVLQPSPFNGTQATPYGEPVQFLESGMATLHATARPFWHSRTPDTDRRMSDQGYVPSSPSPLITALNPSLYPDAVAIPSNLLPHCTESDPSLQTLRRREPSSRTPAVEHALPLTSPLLASPFQAQVPAWCSWLTSSPSAPSKTFSGHQPPRAVKSAFFAAIREHSVSLNSRDRSPSLSDRDFDLIADNKDNEKQTSCAPELQPLSALPSFSPFSAVPSLELSGGSLQGNKLLNTPGAEQLATQTPNQFAFCAGFDFLSVLGTSKTAKVCCVQDKQTKELFALKISTKRLQSKAHRKDCLREFESVSGLRPHPHVMSQYNVWQEHAQLHIQMELCKGGSLKGLLAKGLLNGPDSQAFPTPPEAMLWKILR